MSGLRLKPRRLIMPFRQRRLSIDTSPRGATPDISRACTSAWKRAKRRARGLRDTFSDDSDMPATTCQPIERYRPLTCSPIPRHAMPLPRTSIIKYMNRPRVKVSRQPSLYYHCHIYEKAPMSLLAFAIFETHGRYHDTFSFCFSAARISQMSSIL